MDKDLYMLELFCGITFIIGAIFCIFIQATTSFILAVCFAIRHFSWAYRYWKGEENGK